MAIEDRDRLVRRLWAMCDGVSLIWRVFCGIVTCTTSCVDRFAKRVVGDCGGDDCVGDDCDGQVMVGNWCSVW